LAAVSWGLGWARLARRLSSKVLRIVVIVFGVVVGVKLLVG